MSRYDVRNSRFTVLSTRYENGRLLVTAKGQAGETFTDIPMEEHHGFHGRPMAGDVGYLSVPGDRLEDAMFRMGHDPAKVPQIEPGEAVLYDGSGNQVKVTSGGVEITHSGSITINGNVTINGTLHTTGNISSDAPDGEEE